jgi:hypothetical protein
VTCCMNCCDLRCYQVNWAIPRDTPQTKLLGLCESVDDIEVGLPTRAACVGVHAAVCT